MARKTKTTRKEMNKVPLNKLRTPTEYDESAADDDDATDGRRQDDDS